MSEEEPIRSVVAKNIRKYRKMRNLTQEKLAEKSDISTTYVANIECGKTWISDKTLECVSKALNIEIYQLFVPEKAQLSDSEKQEIIQKTFKTIDESKESIYENMQKIFEEKIKLAVSKITKL